MNSKSIILKSFALSLLLSVNVRPTDEVTALIAGYMPEVQEVVIPSTVTETIPSGVEITTQAPINASAVEIAAQVPSRFSWIGNGFSSIKQTGSSWFNSARTFVTANTPSVTPKSAAYGVAGAVATGAGAYGVAKLYQNRQAVKANVVAGYNTLADKVNAFRAAHPTATKVALGSTASALIATGIMLLAHKTGYLAQALDYASSLQIPALPTLPSMPKVALSQVSFPSTETAVEFVGSHPTAVITTAGTAAAVATGGLVNQFVSSRKSSEHELVALCKELNAKPGDRTLLETIANKAKELNNDAINVALYGNKNLKIQGVVSAAGDANSFKSQLSELETVLSQLS